MSKFSKDKFFDFTRKYGIVIALLIMIAIISIFRPTFLTQKNLFNVLMQSSIYGIMALGVTLIIISGGIDLSLGSMLAFSGIVGASFGQLADASNKILPFLPGLPLIAPVLVTLLIGTLGGGANGYFISKVGLPPFIATLGMTTILRGFALIYSHGKPVSDLLPSYAFFGERLFGVVPVPVIIYAIAIIVTQILLNHTSLGLNAYAIGANINAASVTGININKSIIMIYAYGGLMCGLSAVVFAGRVGSVHPGAAVGYELTAIAATIIGGTSSAGGVGTVFGAVIGALVLGVLSNGMTLLGIDAYWQQVVQGLIIIIAVTIDKRKNVKK
ncbi:MAG: ABC transporter permease [Oscillospiraceae bacterium]|nr:ABC transporter permease [Oscillospiraceae bacterium]